MWTYLQSSGRMTGNGLIFLGYSGFGAGRNNSLDENVPFIGPIPVGGYEIEIPFDSVTHGPYAMHLLPDPSNEMFGRAGFLIHGDSKEHPGCASEGCIILPMWARRKMWESGDHRLQVVREVLTA